MMYLTLLSLSIILYRAVSNNGLIAVSFDDLKEREEVRKGREVRRDYNSHTWILLTVLIP